MGEGAPEGGERLGRRNASPSCPPLLLIPNVLVLSQTSNCRYQLSCHSLRYLVRALKRL